MVTKNEALKMAIEVLDSYADGLTFFGKLEAKNAYNACKEALKPNPDCDEACMFQCQMEKEHGMTYEQGFDHGWEARLAEEQPAQDYVLICKRCGDDLGLEYVPDEQASKEKNG